MAKESKMLYNIEFFNGLEAKKREATANKTRLYMIDYINDNFFMLDRALKNKEKIFDINRKAWKKGSMR